MMYNWIMVDIGYVAGLVDGEGTVTITQQTKYKKQTSQYRTWVYIVNTYKPLIELLKRDLGGSTDVNYDRKRITALRKKPLHRWRVMSHSDVKKILEMVLPYLVVKRRQAELVLQFVKSRQSRPQNTPYTEEETALYKQVRALNARLKQKPKLV
jgi:hypothetical protein